MRTGRLRLRALEAPDVDVVRAHWGRAEVRRHLFDDQPVSRELAAELVARSERDFSERRYGLWGVEYDSRLVGVCGLIRHENDHTELLYSLDPGVWGLGLAREASVAVLNHAFGTLGLERVMAEIDAPNTASIRLAGRLGMRLERVREGDHGPLHRFRVTAEEWRARETTLGEGGTAPGGTGALGAPPPAPA